MSRLKLESSKLNYIIFLFLFCFIIKKGAAQNVNFSIIKFIITSNYKPNLKYYKSINGYSTILNQCIINNINFKKIKNNYFFSLKVKTSNFELFKFEIFDNNNKYLNISNRFNEFLNDIYILTNNGDNITVLIDLIEKKIEFKNDNAVGLQQLQKQFDYKNYKEVQSILFNYINKKIFFKEFDNYIFNIKQNLNILYVEKKINLNYLKYYLKNVKLFATYILLNELNNVNNKKIEFINSLERYEIFNELLKLYPIQNEDYKFIYGDEIFQIINHLKFCQKNNNYFYSDSSLKIKSNLYYIKADFKKYFFYENNLKEIENLYALKLLKDLKFTANNIDTNDIITFDILFPKSIWLKYIVNSFNYNSKIKYINKCDLSKNEYDTQILKKILPITFINDSKMTLHNIINKFKNNPILIDLWATWCGNCFNEFKYNNILDSFLKLKHIQKIYISFDNILLKEKWINVINKYKLGGVHIIANNIIKEELTKMGIENLSLPRYIFLNKDGKLISADAPRPSDPKLIELIEKNL